MKSDIKAIIISCSLFMLFTNCEREHQDPIDIPDKNLLHDLIDLGLDTNEDGEISYEEAHGVIQLSIGGVGAGCSRTIDYCCETQRTYTSLKGIEAFVHLQYLSVTCSNLKEIDLSDITFLTGLDCDCNQLTSLNVGSNASLTSLNCFNNQLSSLDLSNNTLLTMVYCESNQLSSLDVSNNASLSSLNCFHNQLSSLNLSSNTLLTDLLCSFNQLTSLDVSKNRLLARLLCEGNPLTDLDVSQNPELWELDCSSTQLTDLDLSKNNHLQQINLRNIPSLTKVCVWEMPFPPPGIYVDTTGSPNVYFTTECSK